MNNEIVQPKKKKPVFLIAFLIILGVSCIGGGYYLNESGLFADEEVEDVSEQYIEPDETEEETSVETQNEQIETPVTKEKNEYEILVGKYMLGNPPANCGTIEVFAKNKVVYANDINSLYAANTVTMNLSDNVDERPDTISLEDFTKEVKKYYGENYNFNVESLVNVQGLAYYKYVDGVFKKYSNNWGGTCGPVSSYRYSDAKKDGDNLEIYVYVVFNGLDDNGLSDGSYYVDYTRTKRIENFNWSYDDDYRKGSLYKFTFKLENDNYVFVSSEPAK